ncbi:MAG: hypothetical protein ACUVV6_05390 [Thermoplasmatota archaeon]
MVDDMENDRVDDMVIEEAKRRKIPPSRVKYEKSHPVVSIRLRQEDKAKLLEMAEKTCKSLARLVQEALDPMKRDIDAAYDKGYEDGWGCFEVPCEICGKNLSMDIKKNEKLKDALLDAFKYWGHAKCIKERKHNEDLKRQRESRNNL